MPNIYMYFGRKKKQEDYFNIIIVNINKSTLRKFVKSGLISTEKIPNIPTEDIHSWFVIYIIDDD